MTRPSILPMLAECVKFEGEPSEYTATGTGRHKAIAAYLQGDEKAFDDFDEEDTDNLLWAADYVKLKAPLLDHPLILEKQRKAVLPNGLPIEGTPDMVCGDQLFDLKWRPRDYAAQMAAYAWMLLDEADNDAGQQSHTGCVIAHLLFAQTQTVRVLRFDADSAWATMKPIFDRLENPFTTATPCSFCGWCARRLHCEALTQQVNIALRSNPEWELPQWHSSKMTTAKEMGLALRIARTLGEWCESVEFHAKEMAVKQGMVPEGFELTSRRGHRFINDVTLAFIKSGLNQAEFLKACQVNLKALQKVYMDHHKIKKTAAERELELLLGDTIKRKDSSNILVTKKD